MKTAIKQLEDRLLSCVHEFGPFALQNAVIIGPLQITKLISGHQYIIAPSFANHTLGFVDWKVARFFEDINDHD